MADEGGRIAGTAIAIAREGIWIPSLFAVDKDYRDTGVGRALLDRALGYGDGARGALIASSQHPAAMRSYARAGFDLHPTLKAEGKVRRRALPSGLRVREGEK